MKKYIPHIVLIACVIMIMGSSIVSPGGIVLLDYVLTPHAPVRLWDPFVFSILNLFSSILGYAIVSKAFFALILLGAGWLGMLFARSIATKYAPDYRYILECIGCLFFVINPFAYERMMVQPTIYMGTILLGYSVYFLLFSLHRFRYISAGIFAGMAFTMMAHAAYMIALIFGLFVVFFVRSWRDIFGIFGAGCLALFLNLNWLLAPFFGRSNSIQSIATFDPANSQAFVTQALEPLNVWGTNILLYGFWGERYANHYANVDFLSSLWWVGGFIVFGIMVFGFWQIYHDSRKSFTFYVLLFSFSLIFGIGIASPWTRGLAEWMGAYIPLWQGYREPQKWIGLIMIVEGIALITSIAVILQRYGKDIIVRISLLVSILLLFLIWSPGPLMGYHGQLGTTVYPTEFQELRGDLIDSNYTGTILALPWHSYIGCSWTGRPTIANPINLLLAPHRVISSDNIEVADILYTNSTNERSRSVERFLTSHDYADIASYRVDTILLMKECANSDLYTWLDDIPECQQSYSGTYLDLYRCQ